MPLRSPRRFAADGSGSVALTTAIVGATVLAMAAVTIDGSRYYLLRRSQQGVADLAAIAAASDLSRARAGAAASLAANGVPASTLAAVELGTYAADPAVAAAKRFTPGGTSPNAARVTLGAGASAFFGAFVGARATTVGTRAIAMNANTAAFALGSTLAGLDGGLANAVLGGLTGSKLSLSALDYAGLASANVDLFGLGNALAARTGASGTFASLAGATVRLADLINAAADAAGAGGAPPGAVSALRAMAGSIGPSGPRVALGSLVGFGAYGGLALGTTPPVSAALPVLPLLGAAARIGAGLSTIAIDLSASALPPAVGRATLKVALGPAAGSTYAAVGPAGTAIHTAQTRVLLTLQLAGAGPLLGGINLPLYAEVAPATATLSAVGCSGSTAVDPAATLAVQPGAVDAWIGAVTDAAMTNMSAPVSPGPAVLASLDTLLGPVALSGRAHATVSNTAATSVPFTRADIAAGTTKRVATQDDTTSLVGGLLGDLQVGFSLFGLAASSPPGATGALTSLLTADLPAIDAELSQALAMLGVTVGRADTWVRAVKCGQGALVN